MQVFLAGEFGQEVEDSRPANTACGKIQMVRQEQDQESKILLTHKLILLVPSIRDLRRANDQLLYHSLKVCGTARCIQLNRIISRDCMHYGSNIDASASSLAKSRANTYRCFNLLLMKYAQKTLTRYIDIQLRSAQLQLQQLNYKYKLQTMCSLDSHW